MSLGMLELEARSFDTGGVYSNVIGYVRVRGPVFGYRRSIYRCHWACGSWRPGLSIQVEYIEMALDMSELDSRLLVHAE
jgi:hypothetical protein